MGGLAKIGHYFAKVWEFVSDEPRESNTEGGVWPALFGTVLMVLLMSLIVTPLGVVAAFYLREYAKQGPLVSAVRIARALMRACCRQFRIEDGLVGPQHKKRAASSGVTSEYA